MVTSSVAAAGAASVTAAAAAAVAAAVAASWFLTILELDGVKRLATGSELTIQDILWAALFFFSWILNKKL
jgi:hypothetical protein